MNQRKELTLVTGACLIMDRKHLLCYDETHSEIELTRGQELLLKKLADNINYPVSMSALYEAYSNESISLDDTGVRDNIAKMKNTFPTCIKGAIKSVRGYGYRLMSPNSTEANVIETQNHPNDEINDLTGLSGDYYGFFLDPVGNGSVLSAFFHIEKPSVANKQQLSICAILGIRNDYMLLSEELVGIFSPNHTDYHQKFKAFISKHSTNNKRCFWADGVLYCHNTVAEIRLKTPIDAQWNIWLDLSSFLERSKQEGDYNYKGGLGFTVALTPSYGTFCCRMGLVRTSYFTQPQKTKDPELQSMLKLAGSESLSPLMLDIQKDRYWYNWFMSD